MCISVPDLTSRRERLESGGLFVNVVGRVVSGQDDILPHLLVIMSLVALSYV